MAFNGAGVFVRLYNWVNDRNASINIRADRMDAEMDGMATALTDCVTRDGQSPATANLPMAGFIHTGVGNGTARNHYAALGQVQDSATNWVVAGGTADAITAGYAVVITALVDGQLCYFRASAANATTTPTFSPNGLTARTITKIGGGALVVNDIPGANAEVILRYNLANTRWELMDPAASVGKVTITQPASASALTINNGATFTIAGAFSNALTFTNTTNATIPAGTVTLVQTAQPTINQPTINQPLLVGVTTNTVAAAGNIGEIISSTCPTGNATVTITIASPGVITYTAHGIISGGNAGNGGGICPVVFTTTGALPTGITAGTIYYTIGSTIATNTFQIATTIANAIAGTAIVTTGSQSGTQTCTLGVPLSNNTTANVSAISLTAGDWDVWGVVAYTINGATVVSSCIAGIGQTSATLDSVPAGGGRGKWIGSVTGSSPEVVTSTRPISLSGTTTIYLQTFCTFTTNTLLGSGFIGARRRQ